MICDEVQLRIPRYDEVINSDLELVATSINNNETKVMFLHDYLNDQEET